jgi:hypothetical protein
MEMKLVAGVLTASLSILLAGPTLAVADGGNSIASATPVVFGTQQFGNTATGAFQPGSCGWGGSEDAYRSFWSLGVMAGDLVTVDWESSEGDNEIRLLPMGTTDFTLFQVTPVAEQSLAGNGKNELQYTSPESGALTMYFRVCSGTPGPYDFLASDQHAVVVGLNRRLHIRRVAKIGGTASLADGTPVPDGLPFTLTAKWGHRSAKFTTTSLAGSLVFNIALPPNAQGKLATFAIGRPADTQFQEAKSASLKVRVIQPRHRHHRR